MTYTYKLSRRLAILRDLAVLPVVLFAACMGETTGPESTSNAIPVTPIAFRVVPSAVTIETKQSIRFRGESKTRRGESYPSPLTWETSGGAIGRDGTFSSNEPGTFKVIGRGRGRQRPDTAIVVVVPPLRDVVGLEVSPESATLEAGARYRFAAVGRVASGDTAPIGVIWTATGGTIDPSGEFTAGQTAGSYQVIASNLLGTLADTASVSVTAMDPAAPEPDPTPSPTPLPEPTPGSNPAPPAPPTLTVTSVILKPASVAIATGSTRQFFAYGRNSAGDSVPVAATYTATGGSITSGGLYTAGRTTGTFRVVAAASGLADTTVVTVAATMSSGGAGGIPYGVFNSWGEGSTYKANTDVFSLSIGAVSNENILQRLEMARVKGKRIILVMTGGAHDQYKTDGVFDMAKWRAKLQSYNTAAIKSAVAARVADGTIIGNSVMDEPHNHSSGGNSWGPAGTMTKARVDQMCGEVKAMFPTMPVGVVHPHSIFEPTKSYRVCDFIVTQYGHRKGDVRQFIEEALAMGRRDGHAIAFSMNILDGGVQAERDGRWACSPTLTAGRGTYDPNCRMTPDQVREWGILLGSAGCALTMWRYDEAFMADPENQRAFKDVQSRLATIPARSCRRP